MKNSINKVSVVFPSKSVNEGFARSCAAAFLTPLDPTVDELSDVKTAVSEAVTNCIVHAYKDTVGDVCMTMYSGEKNEVEIIIKDKGCGIEDVERAREPMWTTGGADRSGMGFTIMESFMDSLSVKSVKGRGTTVKMKKRISVRGKAK